MESSFNDPQVGPEELPPIDEGSLAETSQPIDDLANPHHPASPDSDSVDFLPIASAQVTLDRIIGLIVTAAVLIGGLIGMGTYFFSIDSIDWIYCVVAAASALVVVGLLFGSFIWPPIEVRNIFWRLESTGLEIRRGVFWKHQISIPASRVQHIDVSQGPLQRNFGLATLTVHTAGTANASVELAGLTFETANELRDQLMEQRDSLNVV